MQHREFNLTAALSNVQGVSISEYTVISPKIARVIANTVGTMNSQEFSDRVTAALKGRVTPIRASFRWLDQGRSALGFVSLQTPVRAFSKDQVGGKYQQINANLFMDKGDESVWEVKSGSGGAYLARTGEDNLAELIEASRVPPRGSTPRMASVVSASAAPKEFVAYVDLTAGIMDYGFCLSADDKGGYSVLSTTTNQPTEVTANNVVGVYTVAMQPAAHKAIAGTKVIAASDKSAMVDYYKKAYGYAPDYLAEIIKQIESMSVA